ncbi:uncharacterized protein IL334_002893 [Kwoniella shivajii]|uniref:Uncharacterized protein n=1 Tax=Kwoniella shivajii TaxID=564305 RepID=A0ABZ1CX57_9TREE|nr:hypothetical protein IL334_002893 [Kwoniella shivajii]
MAAVSGLTTYHKYIAGGLGLVFTGLGLAGIYDPLNQSHAFGLVNSTNKEITFYPGLSARNISAGLYIFYMINQNNNQKRNLGVFLLVWTITSWTDYMICLNAQSRGEQVNMGFSHAITAVLTTVFATRLLEVW